MTPREELDAILEALVEYIDKQKQHRIEGAHRSVLWHLLHDGSRTYEEMAQLPGPNLRQYKPGTLKTAKSSVFKILEQVFQKSFKKQTLKTDIEEWYQQQRQEQIHKLYGRERDISTLIEVITQRQHRLICLTGPPRIGKTAVAQSIQQHFENIPKSKRPFERITRCKTSDWENVSQLCEFLLKEHFSEEKVGHDDPVLSLASLMRHRHCLLILDQGDALYDSTKLNGHFHQNSTCYSKWLQQWAEESSSKSCLLWVSRTSPDCLNATGFSFYEYPLGPVNTEAAEKVVRTYLKRSIDNQGVGELVDFCARSPGILNFISIQIRNKYFNDIYEFLQTPLGLDENSPLWDEIISSLSLKENILLEWLLLYPCYPVNRKNIKSGQDKRFKKGDLSTLSSLWQRGLLATEKGQKGNNEVYFINSLWWQHLVARNSVRQVSRSLEGNDIEILDQYPLIPAEAPAWKRQWHWQYVLEPLEDYIRNHSTGKNLWTNKEHLDRINQILQQAAQRGLSDGYIAGNLLNIAAALKIPLRNMRLSNIKIASADFSVPRLDGIIIEDCILEDINIPIRLYGKINFSISPNGEIFSIGDGNGNILCWKLENKVFQLYRFYSFPPQRKDQITAITFCSEEMLVFSIGQDIFRWWIQGDQESPDFLFSVPSDISCLEFAKEENIAVGLVSGEIYIWQEIKDSTFIIKKHEHPIRALTFTDDTSCLFSIGYGDRILEWKNINTEASEAEQATNTISSESDFYVDIACKDGKLVTASVEDNKGVVRLLEDGIVHNTDYIVRRDKIRLSRNGHYFALIEQNNTRVFLADSGVLQQCLSHEHSPEDVIVSDNGEWLLLITMTSPVSSTVQVWNLTQEKLWWEATTSPQKHHPPRVALGQFVNSLGLSTVEENYLRSLGFEITK